MTVLLLAPLLVSAQNRIFNGHPYELMDKYRFIRNERFLMDGVIVLPSKVPPTPGSIDYRCVKSSCNDHFEACINNSDCDKSFACVSGCGNKFSGRSISVQQKLWKCVNMCYLTSNSALFDGLSLCAQNSKCITRYDCIDSPVPTFVHVADNQLSSLNGEWNIVAGINQPYDIIPDGTLTISRLNSTSSEVTIKANIKKIKNGIKKGKKGKKGGKGSGNENCSENTVFRTIQGNLFSASSEIFYQSPIAYGYWYNLGFSADKKMVIIYYTADNHLSNLNGGYILRKSGTFDQKAKDEAKNILRFAFGPRVVPSALPIPRGAGALCLNPTSDICSVGYTCCIASMYDLRFKKFTCGLTKKCVGFPFGYSPSRKNSTCSVGVSGSILTLEDFEIF